jgi:hypothetical protein
MDRPELDELEAEMDALEARLEETDSPPEWDRYLDVVSKAWDSDLPAFRELLRRGSATDFDALWSRYREVMLSAARHYLDGAEEDRERLRMILDRHRQLAGYLGHFLCEQKGLIRSEADEFLVRSLLALVAMRDSGERNYAAMRFILSDLWGMARRAGIDVARCFAQAAAMSSDEIRFHGPEPPEGRQSSRRFFEVFAPYEGHTK